MLTAPRGWRAVAATASAAVAVLLPAGCATSVMPTAGHLSTCRTAGLTIVLDSTQAGGAGGSSYLPLDFTNSSGAGCELAGFPGVSFVSASRGGELGATAARNDQFSSVRVTLFPGQSAHAWLQIGAAQNYPASSCEPATVNALRVYPPGNVAAAYVHRSFDACRSPAAQMLAVTPVRAGKGMRGAMP